MIDWFDTDEGDTVLDSTVLVDEDNITDCGVIDDQRNDWKVRSSSFYFLTSIALALSKKTNNKIFLKHG